MEIKAHDHQTALVFEVLPLTQRVASPVDSCTGNAYCSLHRVSARESDWHCGSSELLSEARAVERSSAEVLKSGRC